MDSPPGQGRPSAGHAITDVEKALQQVQDDYAALHSQQAAILDRLNELATKQEAIFDYVRDIRIDQGPHRDKLLDIESMIRDDVESMIRNGFLTAQGFMSLSHEIATVNSAAFAEYRNAFQSRNVAVVGSGPTLSHYSPIPGAVHIGVASTITSDRIPLDFYFAQDFGGHGPSPMRSWFESAQALPACKVFFGLMAMVPNGQMEASESLTARIGATRYFVDPSPTRFIHQDIRFHPLMDFYTVAFPALHFALFTNPRRIYLVGCDTSYFGHFDGSPQPESDEEIRVYLTNRLIGYRRLREFARTFYPDTEIVSLNPVNLTGMFTDRFSPGATYRTSPHQAQLAAADFSDEAISVFVERHLAEART